MSTNQPFEDVRPTPPGVGKDESSDPNDPDAAPIVDMGGSWVEPDPAYQDDQPVGAADADEDARQAGGER